MKKETQKTQVQPDQEVPILEDKKQVDVALKYQWNHPDRMRIPRSISVNPNFHFRWVHEENIYSREYDGYELVKPDTGGSVDGLVRNGSLVLMMIPTHLWEEKKSNLDMLTAAQKNQMGGKDQTLMGKGALSGLDVKRTS